MSTGADSNRADADPLLRTSYDETAAKYLRKVAKEHGAKSELGRQRLAIAERMEHRLKDRS